MDEPQRRNMLVFTRGEVYLQREAKGIEKSGREKKDRRHIAIFPSKKNLFQHSEKRICSLSIQNKES